MTGSCAVCQAVATQCCSSCHLVFYCSREHQKQHWKIHKTQCTPYKVEVSERLGHHVVATRDIQQGEVIIEEEPIVLGPKVLSLPLCLGCGRRIKVIEGEEVYKCSGCGWPLCGSHCETSPFHVPECNLMKERGFRADINLKEDKKEAAYCSITPLRCLLLKKHDQSKYEGIVKMQSHLKERRDTPLYNIFKNNVVGFLRNALGMTEFSEETILRITAILDTNSFEIRRSEGDIKVRGLYSKAAMLSHDCKPNTKHFFRGPKYTLKLVSTVPIKKGEIICVTYTQTLWGTLERRAHLKQSKCFDCTCLRCSDATELGTYIGAINCSQCKKSGGKRNDKLISTSPLEPSAPWKCEVCSHTIPGRQMAWGNDAIRREISALDKSKPQGLEDFLDKYKGALHPANGHILEVKYALSQMYGNMQGFLLSELPDRLLERKINLCTELLEIADVLDPGSTRLRGVLLYDLQATMVVQAKRDLASDKITKAAAQDIMGESMTLLQLAAEILKTEDDMAHLLQDKLANLSKELECDS
ncbi:protein msta [Zootermopsis nevadensis]|nr:protein msta [Zootermopsis nevadensis]